MDSRISLLIDSLPTLTKADVDIHDYCPICFVDFKTILDDDDSERTGAEPTGITRLEGCSHVFCRKDLILWIQSLHGSCPTCRNIFLSNLHPDSESEDESDGGEYEPNEFEEEEGESSFEAEPEELDDLEAFEEEDDDEFEEEDDHAMGLGITDLEFYDEELSIEAAAARQEAYVEEQVQAAEAEAARIEAEEVSLGAEEFSYEDALEEAHRQSEEADYFPGEEEVEECTDLPDWDIDAEELGFSVADADEVLGEDICEGIGDEVDVDHYEEFDQR